MGTKEIDAVIGIAGKEISAVEPSYETRLFDDAVKCFIAAHIASTVSNGDDGGGLAVIHEQRSVEIARRLAQMMMEARK